MLEMLINPRRAERKSWEMFFVGLVYGGLSIALVQWIFAPDTVLWQYSGIFMVTFAVIFSMPFIYYTIKLEEEKDITYTGAKRLLAEHSKALLVFLFLFLGFIVSFSIGYIAIPDGANNFKAQVETFCQINRPEGLDVCVQDYGITADKITGHSTNIQRTIAIFANNIYVLIFTLFFSLLFGAGAIFILAWNASVIAAAIGIFSKSLSNISMGLLRYMIHGIPEIAAYFVGALAGGILSVAIIKHDTNSRKFWSILQDSLNLIIVAVLILVVAALIEVFITPVLF